MFVTQKRLWLVAIALGFVVLIGSYMIFDHYINSVANEMINAVVRSEAASIQQGNLLNSITKLQSLVDTSENLRGVAAFDSSIDPHLTFPLITLGPLPDLHKSQSDKPMVRIGVFDRLFFKSVVGNKVLVFYFRPRLAMWSYGIFNFTLISFFFLVALLGQKFETLRVKDRAEVFQTVWKQIAHDVKSPMGALRIFSSSIEKQGINVDLISSAIARIEEILADLRVESESANELYSSNQIFRADLAIDSVIKEKSLEFGEYIFTSAVSTPCLVSGSEGQFKRVISNLLNNAVEASPKDHPIQINLECRGSQVLISLIDRGRGIPLNKQDRLFTKGYTLRKSGNGLGLYHAKRVVSGMGGEISLNSSIFKGTEVTLKLALKK